MAVHLKRIANSIAALAGSSPRSRSVWALVAAAVAVTASAVLLSTFGGGPSRTAHADHGGPHLLARGEYTDHVRGLMMVRLDGNHPMRVIHVNDASDAVFVEVTIRPGEQVIGWHTHPAPVLAVVAEGELTITFGHDCVQRTYPAGSAWLHGAEGHPDLAENLGDVDMKMYALVLGLPPETPVTVPAENPGC